MEFTTTFVAEPEQMADIDEKCLPDTVAVDVVTLVPIAPSGLSRYTRGDGHVDTYVLNIWPLMYSHPSEPLDRTRRIGWDRHVHPEGNPYYYNHTLQIVTSCDIIDDDVNACVKAAVAELKTRILVHLMPQDSKLHDVAGEWHCGNQEWELALEICPRTHQCRYYIADWKKRSIFWVEEDPNTAVRPLSTASLDLGHWPSYDMLCSVMQHQFWKHVEYFPDHRALPDGALDDLKAILLYSISDRMTSVDSTISTPTRDMHKFLKMLTSNQWNTSAGNGPVASAVARQWYNIFTDRTHNLHGEHNARLSRDQSRFHEPLEQAPLSLLARTLSCMLLFDKPRSFYRRFCKIWVDRSVYTDQWRELMKELQQDWRNVLLMSTVMLATNIGFMLVEQLASSYAPFSIAARTLSIISTILTIASIGSGLLLSHQHRAFADTTFTCKDAATYMNVCHESALGLFGTSMIMSLPFAMMVWSLVLFAAGIVLYSLSEFSRMWSPFIIAAVAIVLLLVAHQGVYFSRIKPESRGSTWSLPTSQAQTASQSPDIDEAAVASQDYADGCSGRISRQDTLVDSDQIGASKSISERKSTWDSLKEIFSAAPAVVAETTRDLEMGHP
ncbi:hypothetical protein EXIGLDRAFT_838689 [Exidia glandulosa HHB12029]|uniref:Caspase family p20 domain-containing protein n=1 Tax=Exidia glandulosa HHB12029 TaxID=1314781 RepID=A0A166A747_EXIGL|nr:hypothetical protein EXIGLDRAFT_838689 [Exidia glandulosa HHB12029]